MKQPNQPQKAGFDYSNFPRVISDLKKKRYLIIIVANILLVTLIVTQGIKPAQRLVTPLINSLTQFHASQQLKNTQDSFAFAPGLAKNKFAKIDFNGLATLAFFDVPISTDEAVIDKDSRGYASFISEETTELFDKAHANGTKVLVTFSLGNNRAIRKILDNDSLQQQFIDDAITEVKNRGIDGISLDFEYQGQTNFYYQKRFTNFATKLTKAFHQNIPNSKVGVVIASSMDRNSLFNLSELSQKTDQLLVMSSDNIVPEERNDEPQNPTYGYDEAEYWGRISQTLNTLSQEAPLEKLSLERAWYGTGSRYPLYKPTGKPVLETEVEPAHVIVDSDTVERLASGVPAKGRAAARKNIPIIAKALEEEGILDSNVLAYALATIEHETDETFRPIEEIQGRFSARRLGYEGGSNYFGRGFIQLTHLRNYRMFGERIGLGDKLAKNPELASDPHIAAKVLAAFFKDNNIANLASKGQFIAARTPVNPDLNGYAIALLAYKYGEEEEQQW